MNRYHFISLEQKKQLRLLRVNGRILHRRIKRGYTISLYQFENFYIEIWENEVVNRVDNLVTFKDRVLLNYPFNIPTNSKPN